MHIKNTEVIYIVHIGLGSRCVKFVDKKKKINGDFNV